MTIAATHPCPSNVTTVRGAGRAPGSTTEAYEAYAWPNCMRAKLKPKPSHSHPYEFAGRCEAISPPTMGTPMNPTTVMACSCHDPQSSGNCIDQPRKISTSDNANINRFTAHTDHATQVAARSLFPPIHRPCSLAPSVT